MRYGHCDERGYGYCASCKPDAPNVLYTPEREDVCESCGRNVLANPVVILPEIPVVQTVCRIF